MDEGQGLWRGAKRWLRRALNEFLAIPLAVVAGFLALTAGLYLADEALWSADKEPPAELLWLSRTFGDSDALGNLLGTVASGVITVTSITFSLLLVAVQQGGSSYTNRVFGQFLRRRSNQLYFGFFVGLSVFALFNLVVANAEHRPVLGALAAVLLTAAGLFFVIVLIYNAIDQLRPETIVDAVRGHVLEARDRQLPLLRATRRPAASGAPPAARRVRSERQGYVASIDAGRIARAVAEAEGRGRNGSAAPRPGIEVELRVGVGDYVAYRDPLAELRCGDGRLAGRHADAVAKAVAGAVELARERSLTDDATFGLQQLATIGWSTISTAKSDPSPGALVCRALRDIIARWSERGAAPEDRSSPVVCEDRVESQAIAVLESFAVVAHESLQHQVLAEIMRTFAALLPDLSRERADQVADIVLRSLSALGEHVLTRELEGALEEVSRALAATGHGATAEAVTRATDALRQSVGALNSRSTRVPTGNR